MLDLVVGNGRDFLACSGVSFEIQDIAEAYENCKMASYSIADIKKQAPDFPIGFVVLPPVRDAYPTNKKFGNALDDFNTAKTRLTKAGAVILSEENAPEWAYDTTQRVVPPVLILDE